MAWPSVRGWAGCQEEATASKALRPKGQGVWPQEA